MTKPKKMRPVLAWAGVVEDRIAWDWCKDEYDHIGQHSRPAVFLDRRAAARRYEHIIRVRITEESAGGRRKENK